MYNASLVCPARVFDLGLWNKRGKLSFHFCSWLSGDLDEVTFTDLHKRLIT